MKRLGTILLIFNILAIDLFVGYFAYTNYFASGSEKAEFSTDSKTITMDSQVEVCDFACQKRLSDEIENLKSKVSSIQDLPTPTTIAEKASVPVPTKAKVKSVSYLPIPGSGNTLNTYWTEITGTDFYMSKSDYPGLTGVYFEANFKLTNGNGTASLRVYDVTNGRGVDGSEISTSLQTSTFVGSGAINLWEGNNHYIVQAKSLTSDTTVFESGRLKIIIEN